MAGTSEISKLIEDYDKAKARYDYWLGMAYSSGQKWSEEKCKLYAREKVRLEGLQDPDTYRWLLRWKLGSVLD